MKDRLLFLHGLINNTEIGSNNVDLKQRYNELKQQYRNAVKEAKLSNNVKHIERSNKKCKAAWDVIKLNTVSPKREFLSIEPDQFNTYFINSVKEIKNKVINCRPSNFHNNLTSNNTSSLNVFKWLTVTPNDVLYAIKGMSNSDSLDIYGMTNNLLKNIIVSLAEPLSVGMHKSTFE